MARQSKSASPPKTDAIQLYRIMPVFKTSLLPVLGFLATQRVAKAFDSNPSPEHWRALFKTELEWQITAAQRTGQADEEQINMIAERWLTEKAASEVIGATEAHKAEIFAELAVSGGMLIDPQSPFQVALDYLQARSEGNRLRMEQIVKETADRSFEMKIRTDDFLSFSPVERLEMMLANMALRGPSGGTPLQHAANSLS
jgi:hypothetical protein